MYFLPLSSKSKQLSLMKWGRYFWYWNSHFSCQMWCFNKWPHCYSRHRNTLNASINVYLHQINLQFLPGILISSMQWLFMYLYLKINITKYICTIGYQTTSFHFYNAFKQTFRIFHLLYVSNCILFYVCIIGDSN